MRRSKLLPSSASENFSGFAAWIGEVELDWAVLEIHELARAGMENGLAVGEAAA